jgi:DNA helicase-2/ATP-dependent DNA helicase PcrA
VAWVKLDGTANDHQRLLDAGRTAPPRGEGSVLIIGESTSPDSQRRFASQTPEAVTVEAVDLRDLISFAKNFDINAPNALQQIAEFAQNVMTNVGAADLINRVNILTRGVGRKAPTDVERAALAFQDNRTPQHVSDLIVEINKEGGVRAHRPDVLRACMRALQIHAASDEISFYEAAVRMREQNRLLGRTLPKRAVGSTLLLKGLEAEAVVILNADGLDARNLYVAMTRGSKAVVICSRSPTLNPAL